MTLVAASEEFVASTLDTGVVCIFVIETLVFKPDVDSTFVVISVFNEPFVTRSDIVE